MVVLEGDLEVLCIFVLVKFVLEVATHVQVSLGVLRHNQEVAKWLNVWFGVKQKY